MMLYNSRVWLQRAPLPYLLTTSSYLVYTSINSYEVLVAGSALYGSGGFILAIRYFQTMFIETMILVLTIRSIVQGTPIDKIGLDLDLCSIPFLPG